MKRNPHTSFRQGQRVIVTLRSTGERILGRYQEKSSRGIHLRRRKPIPVKDIRTITIYRGQNV